MLISGVQKITLLDYPDHIACIVFTAGCNFRCGYCHNPEFVLPEMLQQLKGNFIPESTFFHFLEQRKNKLEAVVITGGEPTLMPDLILFIKKIKKMGFLVKLDSNGNNPFILRRALEDKMVDYIAMDIKTSLGEYKKLVGNRAEETKLSESIKLLKTMAPDYEFRSTLIKEVHTPEILAAMSELLRGAKRVFLQKFRPTITLNPLFQNFHAFSDTQMEEIKKIFEKNVETVYIRSE